MKMKTMLSVCVMSLFCGAVQAAPKDAPAIPEEVKKIVDAFVGKWAFDATITMPGAPEPIKAKLKFACKKLAAGYAAECVGGGTVPGMGKIEEVLVVGYDVENKSVLFANITNQGEAHGHKCAWKDMVLDCEVFKAGFMGKPATETLSMTWSDAKTMSFKSTTKTADGAAVVFEGVGKRK